MPATDLPQRLLVRDPARAPQLKGAAVSPAAFTDRDAVCAALDGVNIVLMVSASEAPDRVDQHRAFVDAAAAAGVAHLVAATLTKFVGRTVTYHPETVEGAYRSRASYGAPSWQVEAWVSTYTAIAAGEMESVTDAIPSLTSHPATSLAELLRAG